MEAVNWVREGEIEELRKWLSSVDVKANIDQEDALAAQRRTIVFGQSSFTLDMSFLLWAVDNIQADPEKRIQMCELLLSYYPSLINHPGPENATALHYASGNGDVRLIGYLMDKGAKILYDDKNETPLHWASLNGSTEGVRLLLQAGANPNDLSIDGKTSLHYGVINKHAGVVALLLSHPRVDPKFIKVRNLALQIGEKEIIQLFDPEKREIIVVSQEQQKVIEEYKERISAYETRREVDLRSIEIAQNKLSTEEESHKKTKELVEKLIEEVRTRTVTEQEKRFQDLKKEYDLLLLQNEELHLKISEMRDKPLDKLETKETTRFSTTRVTMTNLMALFNAANQAINKSKLEVESFCKYLPVLNEKTEGGESSTLSLGSVL